MAVHRHHFDDARGGFFPDNNSGRISAGAIRALVDSVLLASEIEGANGITVTTVDNEDGSRTTTISYNLQGLPVAKDNGAAVALGLKPGDMYCTGGNPSLVCIVN